MSGLEWGSDEEELNDIEAYLLEHGNPWPRNIWRTIPLDFRYYVG